MRFLVAAALVSLIVVGCKSAPPSVNAAVKATNLVKEGDKLLEKGDLDAAMKNYEEALEIVPNAPKFRLAYAQLLYWKGLAYSQSSHRDFRRTEGWVFDDPTGKWEKQNVPTQEEIKALMTKSAQDKREGLIYFNKSLQQLMRCDIEWNYAVESVPFAMGMVYVFMEEYAKARDSFNRVLSSTRVSKEYREKIAKVMELIEKYEKELDREGDGAQEDDLLP